MDAVKRMYLGCIILALLWLSAWWEWLGPVKLPVMLWAEIALPIAVVSFGLVYQTLWAPDFDGIVPPTPTGWPHDPDPTEQLTRPMADPYATQPYDPQMFIPTQPIDYDDTMDMLPRELWDD